MHTRQPRFGNARQYNQPEGRDQSTIDSQHESVGGRTAKNTAQSSTGHTQRYDSNPSRHVPPDWHGKDKHVVLSVLQSNPYQPAVQVQVKPLTTSWQVPPLEHGCDAHSTKKPEERPS
jgi:hypothetical protein